MFKHLLAILLVLFLCVNAYAQAQLKKKVEYDYLLSLPKNYDNETKKFPLVVYLHGGSQRGNDLNKLKTYGLPQLVDKGQEFDFIIASPQCPGGKFWSSENWFEPLYDNLLAKYRIDRSRVYLTGMSMGGYGVFITAMDFPEIFAAIVPMCGGCNDSDTTRIHELKNIPVWAFHGTDDNIIPYSETERVVKGLEECGGLVKFTALENEGHYIQHLYETKPEIYKWLLKQVKGL